MRELEDDEDCILYINEMISNCSSSFWHGIRTTLHYNKNYVPGSYSENARIDEQCEISEMLFHFLFLATMNKEDFSDIVQGWNDVVVPYLIKTHKIKVG